MVSPPVDSTDCHLSLPEIIWLEPEQLDRAIEITHPVKSEVHKWQTYLNALALFGFEEWLRERIPEKIVNRNTNLLESVGYLKVGKFKLCLIATEHLLDEVVNVPQNAIEKSELAAHFYVLLEVLEEQEQVIVRSVGRYDQLVNYLHLNNLQLLKNSFYQLPLSLFDAEPNDLLVYCRLLEPTAIPLPFALTHRQVAIADITPSTPPALGTPPAPELPRYLKETRTKLSQWIQGVFDSSWLDLDALISPEADLTLSTRNAQLGVNRGKLIDLGMQLGNQRIVLLVTITEEAQEKLRISIQLHPTGGQRYLPPLLKLTLLSQAGKSLQEVTSRVQDNYIQLKPFKGESGKRFSIEVSIGNVSLKEEFEL